MKTEELSLEERIHKILDSMVDEEYMDILPIIREHIKELDPLMDTAILWELPYIVFHDGYMGLRAIGYHTDSNNNPFPGDYEYDCVLYKYEGKMPSYGTLLQHLAIIMVSDCTGCCNALEYLRISKHGILAFGNISNTYHS